MLDKKSCAQRPLTTWIFSLKSQFWNHSSRAIQGLIPVPLVSSSIIGRIPIKNINWNAVKRYPEVNLSHIFFIIVFCILSIFTAFYSWILVYYEILKLTVYINCVFVLYPWLCHWCRLGFFNLRIRAFEIKQNWGTRPKPLNLTHLDEQEPPIAINLWGLMAYSLFFHIALLATFKNRCLCLLYFQKKNTTRKMTSWQSMIRWFEIRARLPTSALFHIILFVVYLFNKMFPWFSWQA